jgi:hypothetical protein
MVSSAGLPGQAGNFSKKGFILPINLFLFYIQDPLLCD